MQLFPKHYINPADKDKQWILQCAKAILSDWKMNETNIFNEKAAEYDRIDKYVLGQQSVEGYKKRLGLDNENRCEDGTLFNTDWSIRPIMSKLRAIGLSKISNRDYNYTCTPIDPIAKDEADKYFNEAKTKIMMREAIQKVAPELADSPLMQKQSSSEPEDMDELEISMNYGFKLKMAMEAELAVQLILYKNQFEQERSEVREHLFDYGVAGYKEWIDENGDVRLRRCHPRNMVMSFCRKKDFSDKTYAGELIEVPLSQLATKFNETEMRMLEDYARRQVQYNSTSATRFNDSWDSFKVQVLDFEIISYNDDVYQRRFDKRGNTVVRPERYDKKNKAETVTDSNGVEMPRYITKTKEVVYRGKWVVGTELIYDYGLATNIKRSKPNRAVTDLSYHFYAYQFKDMKAVGMVERIIPIIDEYQETIYRIQNFKNKWVPYIVDIDLDAIESVALGDGGKAMTPREVIDMVYQNFTLVSRRSDIGGNNPNYKSVDIRPSGMSSEFAVLRDDLARLLAEMRDMLGLNEVTDGSSPNPNMLNYVASLGAEATNNAIRPMMDADKMLGEKLVRGLAQRMVQAVKRKNIEGLLPALGQESMRFIAVSPDIALHDWGIMTEDKPTMEERSMLIQQLSAKELNGQIEMEDYVMVMETQNLKQARAILAHRMRKRKKERQDYEMQQIQMNGQTQIQSAQAASESRKSEIQLENEMRASTQIALKQMDMEIARMKIEATQQAVNEKNVEKRISENSTAYRNR